jgi:hypothetical protein
VVGFPLVFQQWPKPDTLPLKSINVADAIAELYVISVILPVSSLVTFMSSSGLHPTIRNEEESK